MSGTMGREFRILAKRARAQGWVIVPSRSGHLKWLAPGGGTVWSSSSPSSRNAWVKHRRMMIRYGYRNDPGEGDV